MDKEIISTIHICHYCIRYMTPKKGDMKKHLEKKTKCQLRYIPSKMISFEEASIMSLNKKYCFDFDYTTLSTDDFIYLLNKYNEQINYIHFDDILKNRKKNKYNIGFIQNKISNVLIDNEENEEDDDEGDEDNKTKKQFICIKCGKEYKYKKNLIQHHKNSKMCETNQLLNNVLNKNNNVILNNNFNNNFNNDLNNNEIFKNINNTLNQNNLLNLNNNNSLNIQYNHNNNFNNNHNSTINLDLKDLKDFGRDTYVYSHIPKSFIKQDDFYLFSNFLNKLLENEQNQNIYFINNDENMKSENKKAIIYADDILYKIHEDKAVYLILQKLNTTIKNIMSKIYKIEEDKEKIEEIEKYYRVVNGHFKHDTIFKDYDLEDKQFYNLTHKRRSRDVYTAKIKNIVNTHGTPISNIAYIGTNHILDVFNPDIEDYASTRLRNKDLKKRKDELMF